MDLHYDWNSLRQWFPIPKKGSGLFCISHNGQIVRAYEGGKRLTEFENQKTEALSKSFPDVPLHLIERKDLMKRFQQWDRSPHLVDQIELLRKEIPLKGKKTIQPESIHEAGFLFAALNGKFSRLLPRSFGLLLKMGESPTTNDLFLVFKNGKLETFHDPKLCVLPQDRQEKISEVIAFLSGKYLIPIQGLVIQPEDWQHLQSNERPWKKALKLLKQKRIQMVPYRHKVFFWVVLNAFRA